MNSTPQNEPNKVYQKVDINKVNFHMFEEQTPSYRSKSIDKKLTDLNDNVISKTVKERDYRTAISLLHQLENYILNQNNQSPCSRNNKLMFFYQLSVCYYNHAVVYQRAQNDQQTANFFEKSLKNFEYMQGYITNREQSVSYSIELAKLQLQFCSILSQNGKHQQAIAFAEKSLQKLIECFRFLQAICFEIIMADRLPETNSNSRDSRSKIQLVNFKKHVIVEAEKVLKQLSTLPDIHEIIIKFRKKYDSLVQKMFFWKDNSENNEKQLRKELQIQRKQVSSERSILGVQKASSIQDILTIEKLTNLQIKSIGYNFSTDPFYLLSNPKLTEMSFYASVIYFTLATEIRFSQVDLNINKLKIDEKYKKLNRDQRMFKCKMIHMKAIEIAGKFLPQKSQFFTHILNRFNKNYKCVMEEINQESREQSIKQFPTETQKKFCSDKEIVAQEEYGILASIKNQTLTDSYYNQQNLLKSMGGFKKHKKVQSGDYQFIKKPKRKISVKKQNRQFFPKKDRSTSGKKGQIFLIQDRQKLRSTSNSTRKVQQRKRVLTKQKVMAQSPLSKYENHLIENKKESHSKRKRVILSPQYKGQRNQALNTINIARLISSKK